MSTYQSSDEYRKAWASVDEAAEMVAKWPEWRIERVLAAQFAKSESSEREPSIERKKRAP